MAYRHSGVIFIYNKNKSTLVIGISVEPKILSSETCQIHNVELGMGNEQESRGGTSSDVEGKGKVRRG